MIRGGRLTEGQERAIARYWEKYVVAYQRVPLPLETIFDQPQDLVVEIGFGMGDSLLTQAVANPAMNFIGIEVHRPGVGKLLQGIAAANINNLRILCHDARDVMAHCFDDGSLTRVQVFFPDPWHKKKHNKRRLIQSEFVALMMQKLKVGGRLHLATDWQAYAEQMLEVLGATPGLLNRSKSGAYMETSNRPQTKFERRGVKLGHGVWDLEFEKTA